MGRERKDKGYRGARDVQCVLHDALLGLLAREREVFGQHARRGHAAGVGLDLSGLVGGRGGDGGGGDAEGDEGVGWLGCFGRLCPCQCTIFSSQ